MARRKAENVDVYIPETGEASQKTGEASCFSGDETVVVALCHPQGIQFVLDGGKRRVRLNGNAVNLVGAPKGILPQGGFGLTTISKTDWDAIQATYGKMEIFKNGLCFAHGSRSDTLAEADEKAEVRHGREPVRVEDAKTAPADTAAIAF